MTTLAKTLHAATWNDASALVRQIAAEHNITLVLWGTGNFVGKPHVQAISRWNACDVTVKPSGDGYLKNDVTWYTIRVGR
jgi:hypothetical protein